MPEAVWNGFLRLSLVSCPVRLAPAASDARIIHLDQLNSRTGNPVTQQFVDSRTGDVVSPDAVVKGHQAADTGYVIITDSELEGLASEPPDVIELAQFSPRDHVGTALTVQTCAGFLLTLASIRLLPIAAQTVGWQWVFLCLVPGPVFGVLALRGLSRQA